MMRVSAAALLAGVAASAAATGTRTNPAPMLGRDRRIVNGVDADEGEWPWFVSIRGSNGGSHYCGGTLVKPDVVVTAAHCVRENGRTDRPGAVEVNVGSYRLSDAGSGTIASVQSITPHPNYDEDTVRNDIAVIRLSQCVAGVTPIEWDDRTEADLFAAGANVGLAAIIGHGTDGSSDDVIDVLQEARQEVMRHSACRDLFQQEQNAGSEIHAATMICGSTANPGGGRNVDTCQGDSGGPFVTQRGGSYVLTGVTSWGYDCAAATPGVYARVSTFVDWLYDNAASNCDTSPTSPPAPTTPRPTSPPSTGNPTPPPTTGSPTTRRPTNPPTTGSPTTRRPTNPPTTGAPTPPDNGNECPGGFTEVATRPSWPRFYNSATGSLRACVAQCERRQDCTGLRWHTRNQRCQVFGGLDTRGSGSPWKNCVPDITSTTSTSTTTSTTTTTSTDIDGGGEVSDRSCDALGWPAAPWNSDICGESDAGWQCSRSASQQLAEDTCLAAGSRLCTENDVYDQAGSGTGCGLNSRPVWTATRCTTRAGAAGWITVRQNTFQTACKATGLSGIRCCADADGGPRSMTADAAAEPYTGSEDNYEAPLPVTGHSMNRPRPGTGTGADADAAVVAADGSGDDQAAEDVPPLQQEPGMAAESTEAQTGPNTAVMLAIAGAILLLIASVGVGLRVQSTAADADKANPAMALDHQIHPTAMGSTVLDALNSVNVQRNPIYYPSANPVGLQTSHFAA